MAMSLPRGFVQDFAYILLAKSRELTAMKVTESYRITVMVCLRSMLVFLERILNSKCKWL